MIVYASGPGSAGYYGAAAKPVLFAATACGLFSLSLLASYSAAEKRRPPTSTGGRYGVPALVAGAGAAALALGAGVFVDVVYGDEFAPAALVLSILALRIPFMALSGIYSSVLIAGGRQVS